MRNILITSMLILSWNSLAETYNCQVIGSYKNMDNVVSRVEATNLEVEANGGEVLFGRAEEPAHDFDSRPETMPWSISINTKKDGAEKVQVLSLRAPNQNASVAQSYTQVGSRYIGFIMNNDLEALCIKK